jgi:hypothetical protein
LQIFIEKEGRGITAPVHRRGPVSPTVVRAGTDGSQPAGGSVPVIGLSAGRPEAGRGWVRNRTHPLF